MNELSVKAISGVSGSEPGCYTKIISDKSEGKREPGITEAEKSRRSISLK